jgi:serine phosphatase RsbU (regulator of sigma subunit)/ligand-binding sensor domain-containing protein
VYLNAQSGNYYISNFSPANYGATDQNRGIVQDKFGRIYVANLSGVLTYDGAFWKLVNLPNESAAISIEADKNGVIFTGGVSELGYLHAKPSGGFVFNSLMNKLPENDRNFSEVWSTLCADNKVFFGSNKKLLVFNYSNFKTFTAPDDSLFHTFYKVRDHIFIRQFNVGFKVFYRNELVKVEGSEKFANVKVRFILPKVDNEFWVGSENGLYLLKLNEKQPHKSSFTKIIHPLDSWMTNEKVYCGIRLKSGQYILGSQKNGLLYLDSDFNFMKSISSVNGLQDDNVSSIFEDNSSNLWLSLNKGISYVETNSPITRWTKYDGINGTIESSCLFNNSIFLGTDKGLQYFNRKKNKFELSSITSSVWDLATSGDRLLIATDGLYILQNNKIHIALETDVVYKMLVDKTDPSIVYVGGDQSIIKGRIEGNRIKILEEYNTGGEVRSILQFGNFIYFGVNGWGIEELDVKSNKVTTFNEAQGLPSLQDNTLFEYNNKLFVGTASGIYSFSKAGGIHFKRDPIYNMFSEYYQISKPIVIENSIFSQVTGGKDEAHKIDEIVSLKLLNKGFAEDKKYLKRIRDVNAKHFYYAHPFVYIATNDGLFAYDLRFRNKISQFKSIISSVLYKDSVLYENISEPNNVNPKLQFDDNNIQFNLSATNFLDKMEIQYSYYLQGSEKDFNKWVKNNVATYPNLNEGKYVFHLKSRDVLGNEGEQISFTFTILPPWYRTILAYIVYVVLLILVVIVIIRVYTKRLKERNIVLEETITLRTKTIVDQKHELEHKNKEIVDSINYAQRIQKSLLASDKMLVENLHEHFILFKPKDIVSGDFYWGAELENKCFALVTADSTGHGVPGAIMSMLNISCLNEAVEGQKLYHTADILNYTRKKIIKHLSNDGSKDGGKDGMDCSLISFNFKQKQIEYSAANNPVWIVRNGELIELKPDKMPVGKHDRDNESFTQHIFDLQKGDTIYALTDGMPDQFGGPKGKKFMYKQLKDFLININRLPLNEQKEQLELSFENWKGESEQVDDVLIIGVRIM